MIVYVAGRTKDFERVRAVQQALIDVGHVISYNWTAAAPDEVWRGDGAMSDVETYDDEYLCEQAGKDRDGATECDVLVLVCGQNMVGSYMEVGMALARGNSVYLLGEPERDSVFYKLPEVEKFSTIEEIIERLKDDDEDYLAGSAAIDEMLSAASQQREETDTHCPRPHACVISHPCRECGADTGEPCRV